MTQEIADKVAAFDIKMHRLRLEKRVPSKIIMSYGFFVAYCEYRNICSCKMDYLYGAPVSTRKSDIDYELEF